MREVGKLGEVNLVCYYGLFRSSRPEVFFKKVFLGISQNSQEDTSSEGLQLY